ncbi:MAG TPA: permease-like cell division protein FtsX [Bacteroidota bacterium]
MQVRYLVKEGFSGFQRAKLSMATAIVTVCISLLLLSCFTILLINANHVVESLREKVEMEAFLQDNLPADSISAVREKIAALDGVRETRYVSKDEAAEIFKEQFGEDIYKVLNFNPLPPSVKISLKRGYRTLTAATSIYDSVRTMAGVEDVIYRKDLLEMLDKRAVALLWLMLGIGIFVTISSIFLVANTIRLAIYSKRAIIRTMKLIGATRGFIRTPFIIEGLIQGFIGGCASAGIVFVIFEYLGRWVSIQLSDFVRVDPYYYAIIVGVGCLLGVVGSLISIRRFIGESVAN